MEVSFEMIPKSRKGAGNERKEREKTKRLFPPYGGSDKNGTQGTLKLIYGVSYFADSCDRDAGAPGFKSEL